MAVRRRSPRILDVPREPAGAWRIARSLLARHGAVLAGLVLATVALELGGCFQGLEAHAVDSFLRGKATRTSADVFLVPIDERSYAAEFGRRSPLSPTALGDLLTAIGAGGPSVLCVDLDTSDEGYGAGLLAGIDPARTAVVLARDAERSKAEREGFKVWPRGILGGEPIPPEVRSGIGLVLRDGDGIVRRDAGSFLVWDRARGWHREPSLAAAVATEYRRKKGQDGEAGSGEEREERFNFFADRYRFPRIPANAVLRLGGESGWRRRSPVAGKVVIVGATYGPFDRQFVTPAGALSGMEILAQAVEAKIRRRGIGHAHWPMLAAVDFLLGLGLLALQEGVLRMRPRAYVSLSLLAVPMLAFLSSWIVFAAWAYWLSFLPTLCGVMLHHLVDQLGSREAVAHGKAGADEPQKPERQPPPPARQAKNRRRGRRVGK